MRLTSRGTALVLVLIVVLMLVLIGTYFVFSMIAQEKTSTSAKHQVQSRLGAEGAKNCAVVWLLRGTDPFERRHPADPFGTPFHDTRAEFEARIPESIREGSIWGIAVRDEQSKVDLRTAPPALLKRLQAAFDSRIVDFRDTVTIYAGRDARWIYPQRIRAIGDTLTWDGNVVRGILVDDASHYGLGSRVRFTRPGLEPVVTTVCESHLLRIPKTDRAHAFVTADEVSGEFAGGVVEVEARHAVNVNTAPRELIAELLTDLHARIADDHVSHFNRTVAEEFAELLQRPPVLRTQEELIARLADRIEEASVAFAKGRISHFQHNRTVVWTRMVLSAILDPNAAYLLGTGTMPLTVLSDDTVTIEALSTVNAPSGVSVAERHLRAVVELGAPARVERRWECQYDFQRYLGYPFGNSARVVTRNSTGARASDLLLRPLQTPDRQSWVQLAASEDSRGFGTLLDSRYSFHAFEHDSPPIDLAKDMPDVFLDCAAYPHTHEGVEVTGSLGADWNRVFAPMAGVADVAAGGVEFWIRFREIPGRVVLFDIREGDFENRVSLAYESGALILSASDGAVGTDDDPIDNGLAEVRHPFAPRADTWYHIGAYWKGTRYGHLAILVDGFGHAGARFTHANEQGKEILTELMAAIGAADAALPLLDPSFLPDGSTPIRIGGEVILYDKTTGVAVRGARGTTAAAHPKGAKVQVFGYASQVRTSVLTPSVAGIPALTYDRLCRGGGSVRYPFGAAVATMVTGDGGIDDSQTAIPVVSIAGFPDQGYVTIGSEVIYYDGLQAVPPTLTGCARGQHGTAAANHAVLTEVHLWSIAVDTYGTDDQYLTPTVLQIGLEWFGPVRKDPSRAGFWIGMQNGATPIPLFRGVLGTSPQAHAAGAAVIPTWVARDPEVTRMNCGAGDRVTLIDDDDSKGLMRVCHAADVSTGFLAADSGAGTQLVAFDANIAKVHRSDHRHVRVLKFPSGELLSLLWLQQNDPDAVLGPLAATVDEVKFFAHPKKTRVMGEPFRIRSTDGMPEYGGAVKVGDEIFGYARAGKDELHSVRRGFLGTPEQIHDVGDEGFELLFLPIAALRAGITAADGELQLRQPLAARGGGLSGGFVLIDREVLLFESRPRPRADLAKPVTELWMPRTHDGSRGLFRGRFGTLADAHAQDALAYAIPWRHADTYVAREFDNRMAYWQVSATIPDARWGAVTWEEDRGEEPVELHVLVRVDARGEFTDPPGAHLFDFTDPAIPNRVDLTGSTNEAGQIDLRFVVEYKAGSFWPNDAWKRTPRLFEARVEYERPTRTLHHEDR